MTQHELTVLYSAYDIDERQWVYGYDPDDAYGDKIKIAHYALTPKGFRVMIDHSPYEIISLDAFEAHAYLGFPVRPADGTVIAPWTNHRILKRLADHRRAWEKEDV